MNNKNDLLNQLHIDRNAPAAPRSLTPWLIAALIGLLLVASAGIWHFYSVTPASVKVQVARKPSQAATSTSVLDATGYVVARRSANVASKVTGKVVELYIEEGMHVEKGQIVAKLDDVNVQKNHAVIQAQLAASKTQVTEAYARLQEAKLTFERTSQLRKQQLISQSQMDTAQANYESVAAQLANREQLVAVSTKLLEQSAQNLDDLILRAPFAGVVTVKTAQQGEMLSAAGFSNIGVCKLVDMTSLEVEVDVNEAYIQRVVPGQLAEAVLEAYPDWKIPAKVIAIIPTADRQKATVKVRIGFAQLDPKILPDMGVKVAFLDSEPATPRAAPVTGIRIPATAVRTLGDSQYLLIVRAGTLEQREIKIKTGAGADVYVLDGLSAGENFVTQVDDKLQPGARVTAE